MRASRFFCAAGVLVLLGAARPGPGAELAAQADAPGSAPARTPVRADTVGRIIGRVVDAASGAPIAGAQVEAGDAGVVGIRATTAADGRYSLDAGAGVVTLRVRMIGFGPKRIDGVSVASGEATVQDVALTPEVVELEEIAVTEAARGSVNRALDEQRYASNIVNAVTSEQIQKSPDGDAGQAVQRVSGVTVQDGRYVFVRGLGERYTTTSLNGARIPSPEPERKIVPLDLFPAGLLEGITTSKTFTPDQPGDFSGAQVNLKTREFPARRTIAFSASGGFNTAATGKRIVQAPTVGPEWLGFAGGARRMPAPLVEAGDIDELPTAQRNGIIGAFRNSWSARTGTGRGNGGLGLSIGGQDPVFGRPIGYLGSFSYGYAQEVRADEWRAIVRNSSDGFVPQNQTRGATARTSVLWGGILNLGTRLGEATKLSLNNTYNRTADNEATRFAGENEEFAIDGARDLDVTRLTFTERTVRSHQLAGQHLLGARQVLDWSVTASRVARNEPDRSDIAYRTTIDPATGASQPYEWLGDPRTATRTFSELGETSAEVAGNHRVLLDASADPASLKVGGVYRAVDRTADSRAYDITGRPLTEAERRAAPESIFHGEYAGEGRLGIRQNSNGGRYDAVDRLAAAYAQLELPLGDRLRLSGGVRAERWVLDLESLNPQGVRELAERDNTDILPALAATYRLAESQNLRLSASQTLSRPEYREIAPVSSFEPIGGTTMFGNPELRRALIRNYDARWEWYPRAGEVLSLAAFAKQFDAPIERVFGNQTGGTIVTFVNAEGATSYGVEIEARKGLDFLGEGLAPFSAFANSTLMRSRIRPGNAETSALTSADRPMVGQAGYVVNAGLGYTSPSGGTSATLFYNVVGSRILEAGTLPNPDAYERPRHMVDLAVQFPVLANASLKLQAKNLLDAPYRLEQAGITRLRYTSGRVLSFGASWQP